jgi:predicted dehydrogenase
VKCLGVIGVGNLGRHHARVYSTVDKDAKILLYDRVTERAESAAREYGGEMCDTIDELLDRCTAVSICTPATHHHQTALSAFERGVHTLIEKPIASTSREGAELVRAASDAGCVLQVGHIERFNGAFEAAAALVTDPMFIEMHRLGTFSPRGTDVSVVVDLMIHDLDLVFALLGSDEIKDLRASGAKVLTGSLDIVNARLEFESGCVANITASRVSREPFRKIRIFQENLYVSADLRKKSVEAFAKSDDFDPDSLDADPTLFIRKVDAAVDDREPLMKEISSFLESVRGGERPVVSGAEALRALEVAETIMQKTGER